MIEAMCMEFPQAGQAGRGRFDAERVNRSPTGRRIFGYIRISQSPDCLDCLI
jgi:hypothetical protein